MRRLQKSIGFLGVLGLVSLLSISACSKSDESGMEDTRSNLQEIPAPPQGNSPASPPSSGGY